MARAVAFAVALLQLASSGEAFFDIFSIFRPPVDSEYFTNAFDGPQDGRSQRRPCARSRRRREPHRPPPRASLGCLPRARPPNIVVRRGARAPLITAAPLTGGPATINAGATALP
ncbi:unnamed protein product [Urochloa humidicola]